MAVILYVISCTIMFSASLAYIPGSGYVRFPFFLKYILALLWFAYSFSKRLRRGNFTVKVKYLKELTIYVFPAILMCVSVILSIIINHNFTYAYFSRSASNILCLLAVLLGVFAALTEFGVKAIDYSFYGLVGSTIFNVLYTIYLYGIGPVITVIMNVIKVVTFSYEAGSVYSNVGYSLEVSDATFAYGFFFLFYLLFTEHGKKRARRLLICIIGLYLGLKRVEIFAIIFAVIAFKLLIRNDKTNTRNLQRIFMVVTLIVSFLFLYLIKYHTRVFSFLDINRVHLYSRLQALFRFSPLYIGKGFGYVNMWLEDVGSSLYILEVSHSEILRMYIELGFIGLIIWIAYYTLILPNYFRKNGNDISAKMILCFSVYIMITYMIDNTLTLFATQYCFVLLPIAVEAEYVKHTRIVLGRRHRDWTQ